jgi:hypothetical protein
MTIRKTIEAWEEWDEWDYHYMLGRYGFWKAAKLHFGIVLFSFFFKMGFNIMTYVMMFFLFNGISPTKWMRMSDRKVIGDGGDGYGGYGAGSFQFQPLLLLFHQHQELRKK